MKITRQLFWYRKLNNSRLPTFSTQVESEKLLELENEVILEHPLQKLDIRYFLRYDVIKNLWSLLFDRYKHILVKIVVPLNTAVKE